MKTNLRFTALFLLIFSAGYGASTAQASSAKNPSYSATEDEIVSDMDAPPAPPPAHPHKTRSKKRKRHEKPVQTIAEDTQEVQSAPTLYDLVPSEQKDPIIQRLRICEELIEKYGRAYDYRVHTLKELQTILAQLEAPGPRTLPPVGTQPEPGISDQQAPVDPQSPKSGDSGIGNPAPTTGTDG